MPSRSVTLVLLGDTHTLHRELDMPAGDILIHTGEWTMWGRSVSAATDFDLWLAELPYRHRIAVRGNHESYIETDPSQRSMLSNAITLVNESATVEGLKSGAHP